MTTNKLISRTNSHKLINTAGDAYEIRTHAGELAERFTSDELTVKVYFARHYKAVGEHYYTKEAGKDGNYLGRYRSVYGNSLLFVYRTSPQLEEVGIFAVDGEGGARNMFKDYYGSAPRTVHSIQLDRIDYRGITTGRTYLELYREPTEADRERIVKALAGTSDYEGKANDFGNGYEYSTSNIGASTDRFRVFFTTFETHKSAPRIHGTDICGAIASLKEHQARAGEFKSLATKETFKNWRK